MNDIIDVLEEVEPGWWKGSLNGKVRINLRSFVHYLFVSDTDVLMQTRLQ